MNSSQPGPPEDDDHQYDATLNVSASKLEVYRYERLAYTEPPVRACASRSFCKRVSAALKSVYHWLLPL